jgi:hypothetical protein
MRILKNITFSMFLVLAFFVGLMGTLSAAQALLSEDSNSISHESFEQPVQAPQQEHSLNKLPTIEC